MTIIEALRDFLVIAAVVGSLAAIAGFVDRRRLKIRVRGAPEVVRAFNGPPREAFVFYVLNERDHPITVEACGIHAQDTNGDYWRLNIGLPDRGVGVLKGAPYRWEMPFGDIAAFGLDVERRVYAFARIAQPPKDVWSRCTTAGPTRGPQTRPRPTPRTRPVGQSRTPPPWWVRLR